MSLRIDTMDRLVKTYGDTDLGNAYISFVLKSDDMDLVTMESDCQNRLRSESDLSVFAYISNVVSNHQNGNEKTRKWLDSSRERMTMADINEMKHRGMKSKK